MQVQDDSLVFEAGLVVQLQRTLRLPADGRTWPLPPGFGPLPIRLAGDELIVPLRQGEALWLAFRGKSWRPVAVQVGLGEVNVVSAEPWGLGLRADPQNYLVCPDQPWLDGVNAGDGTIRQFVAAPLGSGQTVEGQLTGQESAAGLRLRVYPPRPGRFPDEPPRVPRGGRRELPSAAAMGLGAGGRMRQKIYPDRHGINSWEPTGEEVRLHMLNSEEFRRATEEVPPPSPISVADYERLGLPFFALYDEDRGDVAAPDAFKDLRGVEE
jgi:hypothetical protein